MDPAHALDPQVDREKSRGRATLEGQNGGPTIDLVKRNLKLL